MLYLINALSATANSIISIIFASLAFISAGFIIFVVMSQKGNSDGTQALSGVSHEDDNESYYGKNSASRKEAVLKRWTYISAGVLAVCCIAMIIIQAIVAGLN